MEEEKVLKALNSLYDDDLTQYKVLYYTMTNNLEKDLVKPISIGKHSILRSSRTEKLFDILKIYLDGYPDYICEVDTDNKVVRIYIKDVKDSVLANLVAKKLKKYYSPIVIGEDVIG